MKEDFVITVRGKMERHGECDNIEMMTRGNFVRRGNSYYIVYKETEATGYAGCVTTVKVEASNKVSMLRYGPAPSQLIVEKGRRHVCIYETGYGSMNFGVAADEIDSHLSAEGGSVSFGYLIDVDGSSFSQNSVQITVKPVG